MSSPKWNIFSFLLALPHSSWSICQTIHPRSSQRAAFLSCERWKYSHTLNLYFWADEYREPRAAEFPRSGTLQRNSEGKMYPQISSNTTSPKSCIATNIHKPIMKEFLKSESQSGFGWQDPGYRIIFIEERHASYKLNAFKISLVFDWLPLSGLFIIEVWVCKNIKAWITHIFMLRQ